MNSICQTAEVRNCGKLKNWKILWKSTYLVLFIISFHAKSPQNCLKSSQFSFFKVKNQINLSMFIEGAFNVIILIFSRKKIHVSGVFENYLTILLVYNQACVLTSLVGSKTKHRKLARNLLNVIVKFPRFSRYNHRFEEWHQSQQYSEHQFR